MDCLWIDERSNPSEGDVLENLSVENTVVGPGIHFSCFPKIRQFFLIFPRPTTHSSACNPTSDSGIEIHLN